MAIQIKTDPWVKNIVFVGVDTTSTLFPRSTAEYIYNAAYITAVQSGIGATHVNIKNVPLSETNGYDTYEIANSHYSEWRDNDGNSFASALEVVNYINEYAGIATQVLPAPIVGLITTVTVNQEMDPFYATHDRSGGYFWDPTTFPPGVEVASYDARVLTGTPTATGTFFPSVTVANFYGITTSTCTVEVVS